MYFVKFYMPINKEKNREITDWTGFPGQMGNR